MITKDGFAELYERIREDVSDYQAGRRGVAPDLGFTGNPSAFLAMTHCSPIVTMRFNSDSDRLATVTYSYVKESKERRDWKLAVTLEIDPKGRSFIAVEDRKFESVSELSEFLLSPLIDPGFEPFNGSVKASL